MTEDEVVAELRDGMTIGIGGWGSRRKPMSLVRAILRATSPTSPSSPTAAPTSGCCARPARCASAVYALRARSTSIPLEPHFRVARQTGAIERARARRGHVPARPPGRGVAGAVPADPGRARLRHRGRANPSSGRSRRPTTDGEELRRRAGAPPRRRARPPEPGRPARQRRSSSARPLLRRPVLQAADKRVRVGRADRRRPRSSRARAGATAAHQPAAWSTAWSRRRTAPTSPTCAPDYAATRRSRRSTPRRRSRPRRGRRSTRSGSTLDRGRLPGRLVGGRLERATASPAR